VTPETQLVLTDWLKGNLTDRLRTRNSPIDSTALTATTILSTRCK